MLRPMPCERNPCVYILTSQPRGTLYIGVTSDLVARLWQHREAAMPGFTKRHGVKLLVWFEMHGDMTAAITREKQLKNWHRQWKINLIEQTNPHWEDLGVSLGFPALLQSRRHDGP